MKMRLSILALTAGYLMSCSGPEKNKSDDAASARYQALASAADSAWHAMEKSDDAKIANMIRLTDELLLLEGCDSAIIAQIKQDIQKMTSLRYRQDNLQDSGLIDAYDSLTTKVITGLRGEVYRIKIAIQYQLINQLMQEIYMADDSVIFLRKNYDHFIDSLNSFSVRHASELLPTEKGKEKVRKKPVFRLVP